MHFLDTFRRQKAYLPVGGAVGVGVVLAGLLQGKFGKPLREGGQLILISLIMFAIAGSFFGALGTGWLGDYWPVLLIALGLLILVGRLIPRR